MVIQKTVAIQSASDKQNKKKRRKKKKKNKKSPNTQPLLPESLDYQEQYKVSILGKEGFGNLWDLITTNDLQDLPMWKSSWTPASPSLWFATLYLLCLSEHIMFSIETLNSLMCKLTHMEKLYFPNSWSNIFHRFETFCVL